MFESIQKLSLFDSKVFVTSDSSQGLHESIHESASKVDFGSVYVNQVMSQFESSQKSENSKLN